MPIWILTSVECFYSKVSNIIKNSKSNFYLEFYSIGAKTYKLLKINEENELLIQNMVMNEYLNYSYRNFGILRDDKEIDLTKSFYSQPHLSLYIIDGRGGRNTINEIECIYLRVLEKEANKSAKSLYSKIVSALKKDIDFKQGFDSDSLMSKRALYDIRFQDKIKKFDFRNPLSIVPLSNNLLLFRESPLSYPSYFL